MLTFKQWLVRHHTTANLAVTHKILTKCTNTAPARQEIIIVNSLIMQGFSIGAKTVMGSGHLK